MLYLPYINFESNYEEEVRNDIGSDFNEYPPILAKNYLEGKGGISEKKLAASFNINNFVSVGVGLSHLCGTSEFERRIIWTEAALDDADDPDELLDYELLIKRDFQGFKFDIGTKIQLNSRIGIGFNYNPQTRLVASGKIDTMNVNDIDEVFNITEMNKFSTPARTRFGVSYQPRNIMRTHFNMDAELVSWAEENNIFDDVFNFYLGVEHHFANSLPFRMGFNYQTIYQIRNENNIFYADKITMPTFTCGTGFNILNNIIVDLSGEFSNRKYETLDLFMDSYYNHSGLWENIQPTDRGWDNPDMVEETFINFKAGISYKW